MRLLFGYGLLLAVLVGALGVVIAFQFLRARLPKRKPEQGWDGVERRSVDRDHRPPAGTRERRGLAA